MVFGCVLQLMLGVPEQALIILHEAIETVLAHGSVMDKGRALMLMARCQLAAAGFSSDAPSHPGNRRRPKLVHVSCRVRMVMENWERL